MGWESIAQNNTPGFVADPETISRNSGRQIDWAAVPSTYVDGTNYTITVNDAAVAEDDTEVTVVALPVALPTGTVLDFGVHSVDGAQMLAKLSAPADAGDTTITTEPLGHEIEDTSTATYTVSASGTKVIPAGTPMAEQEDGTIVPATVAGADAAMLLWTTASEGNRTDALSGFGCLIGGVIYSELLPVTIADYATALAANGCLFQYETYADNREVIA